MIEFEPLPGGLFAAYAHPLKPNTLMVLPRLFRRSVLFIPVLVVACSSRDPSLGTLGYGLTLAPTGIDPHLNASVELGIPLSSVYDTLVYRDSETNGFVPGLATEWEVSPDGLSYTFFLREDVRFHDGEQFDAEAVRANLEYTLDPEHASQKAASMLGPLLEIEVLDPYTVALHLEVPFSPLLDSLSQVYLGMASPKSLTTWGPGDYQFHQVGTGPYRFVEYLQDDHLTLQRNPDYAWGPEIYSAQTAQIETITFRFFEDVATRAPALESGAVDIIGELPANEVERIAQLPDLEVQQIPIPGQPLQFMFNTELAPTDDVRVRQALVLGVDRAAIVSTVFGGYSPVASGPLAGDLFAISEEAAFPEYDPLAARELLGQAGWGGGTGLELRLVVPNWGSNPEVGQLVAAAWEQLGAAVTLEVAAGFGPLSQARGEGNYHAIGMNSFGTDPDLLRPFFASDGFFNWSGYHDPRFDQLLTEGTLESQSAQRSSIYSDLAERVREQWLILPIREYVNLVGVNRRVEGLRFSPQGWFPYLIDLHLRP